MADQKLLDALDDVHSAIEAKMMDRLDAFEGQLEAARIAGSAGGGFKQADPSEMLTKAQSVTEHDAFKGNGAEGEPVSIGRVLLAAANGKREALNAAEQKALDGIDGSAGGYLNVPELGPMIDRARNASRVIQAGARTLPMRGAEMILPKLKGSGSGAWKAENAAVSVEDPEFSRQTLIARTCAVIVKMSAELAEDMSSEAVRLIENDLTSALALKLDYGALYGAGSLEPLGIRGVPGVDVTPIANNGAVPADYDFISDAMFRVQSANGEPTGMIYSPRTANTFRKLKRGTDDKSPLPMHPEIAALGRYVTNQVPNDLTEGSANDVCSDLFIGDWSQVVIGVRPQLGARMVSYRIEDTLSMGLLAWLRADVTVMHPEHMAVVTGLKAA